MAKFGATNAFAGDASAASRSASRSKPGGADDDVPPGGEHGAGVVERRVGPREVDDDVAAAEDLLERRAERRVGAAGELEPVGGLHGGAHRLAHAARGARHGHPDHQAVTASAAGQTGATASQNASCDGPMPAAESRSGAHSSSTSPRRSSIVTASTFAMISSASSSGRP